MKNIFYKLLFVCTALLSLQGCALENEIYDEINPDIFPQSADDVDALVTASAYNVFCSDQYNGIFAVATGYITSSDIVTLTRGMLLGGWRKSTTRMRRAIGMWTVTRVRWEGRFTNLPTGSLP